MKDGYQEIKSSTQKKELIINMLNQKIPIKKYMLNQKTSVISTLICESDSEQREIPRRGFSFTSSLPLWTEHDDLPEGHISGTRASLPFSEDSSSSHRRIQCQQMRQAWWILKQPSSSCHPSLALNKKEPIKLPGTGIFKERENKFCGE